MRLVEIFLPLADNEGRPFGREAFRDVREELVERFGGLTAFTRAPAEGLWADEDGGQPVKDDIVVFEVMDGRFDRTWWRAYRERLEARFRQDEILIRATETERL
jgi:hypothetical protein